MTGASQSPCEGACMRRCKGFVAITLSQGITEQYAIINICMFIKLYVLESKRLVPWIQPLEFNLPGEKR